MNPRRPGAEKLGPLCPLCGSRTALHTNPHFGVGLAVHRYLRVCVKCDWIAIVREQPTRPPAPTNSVSVKVEVEVEVVKPARDRRGFRKRRRKTTTE
jgi:hypothetical protein